MIKRPPLIAFVFLAFLGGPAWAGTNNSDLKFADNGRSVPYMIRVEGLGPRQSQSKEDFDRNSKEKKEECRSYGGTQFVFIYGRPETQKTDEGYVTAAVGRCE